MLAGLRPRASAPVTRACKRIKTIARHEGLTVPGCLGSCIGLHKEDQLTPPKLPSKCPRFRFLCAPRCEPCLSRANKQIGGLSSRLYCPKPTRAEGTARCVGQRGARGTSQGMTWREGPDTGDTGTTLCLLAQFMLQRVRRELQPLNGLQVCRLLSHASIPSWTSSPVPRGVAAWQNHSCTGRGGRFYSTYLLAQGLLGEQPQKFHAVGTLR